MPLPDHFQFSQGSLQDFVDCPRRFQLKYIQQLAWPAVEAEPARENELYLQQGAIFHRLVQQYFLGVPLDLLTRLTVNDFQLAKWWENFTAEIERMENWKVGKNLPEISLSAPLKNYRLVGKYDLLTMIRGEFAIYDWKTSRKQPKREWMAASLQTRVYPYLLIKAGSQLNSGKPIEPDQNEMIYWFANFPNAPLRFPYSQVQYAEDEKFITNLILEIESIGEEPAPLTDHEKRCRFCVYRSLCNRGVEAGPLAELEDEDLQDLIDFDLDFDQIAEIEF